MLPLTVCILINLDAIKVKTQPNNLLQPTVGILPEDWMLGIPKGIASQLRWLRGSDCS
jgi:hypothetical protein